MALIGSKKVNTTVVTVEGAEYVIEFRNGIAKVPKNVKHYLLKRDKNRVYFDPNSSDAGEKTFDDDYEAISFYINKIKVGGNVTKLLGILKGEYETLQGEVFSGKYNTPGSGTEVRSGMGEVGGVTEKKAISKAVDEEEEDEDVEELVGVGDKILSKSEKKRLKIQQKESKKDK